MKRPQPGKKLSRIVLSFPFMVILFAAVLGTGCSESGKAPEPASPVAAKPRQEPASQATPTVAETAPQPEYSYDPSGRRDPFAPIIQRDEKKARGGDLPPLERYGLYEFKLAGIVWGGYGYTAMLEGPDGKGYFVRTGSIIGPNKGVVKKITQNALVIEEQLKTESGKIERKERIIEVQRKQEGMQ